MNDDYLLRKIEDSHQAIAKTVSVYGDKVNKTDMTVTRIDTKLSDFIDKIDKKMIDHDKSIKDLDEAKTTIFTSLTTTKKVAGVLLAVIISMGGFIMKTLSEGFNERLNKIESEDRNTYKTFIKMLEDKKNYLNQSELKDIIANIYR